MEAFSDRIPFSELESSREPPETISSRSLGQAADALTTPKVSQLCSLRLYPESPYRSAHGRLSAAGSLGLPSFESTGGGHEYAVSTSQEQSPYEREAVLATPSHKRWHRQDAASPGTSNHTSTEGRHDADDAFCSSPSDYPRYTEVPLLTPTTGERSQSSQILSEMSKSPRGTSVTSTEGFDVDGENARGAEQSTDDVSTPPHPSLHNQDVVLPTPTHQLQQELDTGFDTSNSANPAFVDSPNHSRFDTHGVERIYPLLTPESHNPTSGTPLPQELEEASQDAESQPRIPGRLSFPNDEVSFPKWVNSSTSFLLSFLKRTLLEFIPLLTIGLWTVLKSIASLLFSLVHFLTLVVIPQLCSIIRDGSIRFYTWCAHVRPTRLPSPHSSPDEAPKRTEDPFTQRNTPRPQSRCSHCLSDYPLRSTIHCPSRHAVCLDCLSSHVAQLAAGDVELVCLHASGCGKAFDPAQLQALPEGVLRQLWALVPHAASRAKGGNAKPAEPAVQVKVEEDDDDGGESLGFDDGGNTSARLHDAISRAAVALRRHRIKGERQPSEAPTSAFTRQPDSDSDSDVYVYAQSVSALTRLRQGPVAGPSTPTGQRTGTATTPHGPRAFATAPPPSSPRRPEVIDVPQRAASTFVSIPQRVLFTLTNVESGSQTPKSLERLKADKTNTQVRLRRARRAHESGPSEKTRDKVELEEGKLREACEALWEYERRRAGW